VTVSATPLGIETLEQFHELGARQMRAFLAHVRDEDLALIERAIDILAGAVPPTPQPTADPASPGSPT
jgi:hypothetical protein